MVTDADKGLVLLKSLAADCDQIEQDKHIWWRCQRCLAVAELDHKSTRHYLRALIAQIEGRDRA